MGWGWLRVRVRPKGGEGKVGPSAETCIDPEFIRNAHHCNNEWR